MNWFESEKQPEIDQLDNDEIFLHHEAKNLRVNDYTVVVGSKYRPVSSDFRHTKGIAKRDPKRLGKEEIFKYLDSYTVESKVLSYAYNERIGYICTCDDCGCVFGKFITMYKHRLECHEKKQAEMIG